MGLMNRAGFWHGSFLLPVLLCVKRKLGISKNRVLPAGTLSQTMDCFGISIVAQERWPLRSMIKWTIIGHLSWQYLWAVMLDHCSLSQWSSSSVYSMISLCRSVSDSWYLCIKSVHCWIIYSSASLLEYCVAKLYFSWLMAGVCFSGYSYLAFSFELNL